MYDKVVYQIYPKSFKDTNGDGIGDIKGIIEKLDYLSWLGVDYLWLTPMYLSPENDNGYDISNYKQINPQYGSMEDLEELIKQADKLNIGIMMDMVFNHTSSEHPWFKQALAGDKYYQDYYIFKDEPTNWESKFGGSAWEYIENLDKYYLHLFDKSQPDLNWDNPQVREEVKNIILFWKEKGIKGFRFDVINLISKPEVFRDDNEGDGRRYYTDGPHVHDYIKEIVNDTGIEDCITVGEMSSTSLDNCIKYSGSKTKELAMCFNFHHLKIDYPNNQKWVLAKPDLKQMKFLFKYWQEGMQSGDAWSALFWCNHDQPRIVSRLGDEGKYWMESAKMLATYIHFLRGTPYIYQGEEIGMTNAHFKSIDQYRDVESLNMYQFLDKNEDRLNILGDRSRDNSRTPMQWDTKIRKSWIEINPNCKNINVENQIHNEDSILNYYRKLIKLRKTYPIIAKGNVEFIDTKDDELVIYKRFLDDDVLICFYNFSDKNLEFDCDLNYFFGNYISAPSNFLRPYECAIYSKGIY